MTTKLAEAVERLRGIDGPTFHGVGGKRHISEREYADAVEVAIAYLSEHPADEDEAVDKDDAFWRALGGDFYDGAYWFHADECEISFGIDGNVYAERKGWFIRIATAKTRGQVRRLLSALGIHTHSKEESGK